MTLGASRQGKENSLVNSSKCYFSSSISRGWCVFCTQSKNIWLIWMSVTPAPSFSQYLGEKCMCSTWGPAERCQVPNQTPQLPSSKWELKSRGKRNASNLSKYLIHIYIHFYLRVAYVRAKQVMGWENLPSKTKEMLEVKEKNLKLVETKKITFHAIRNYSRCRGYFKRRGSPVNLEIKIWNSSFFPSARIKEGDEWQEIKGHLEDVQNGWGRGRQDRKQDQRTLMMKKLCLLSPIKKHSESAEVQRVLKGKI